MLSEKQHIDDYFRQKEDAFMPDEQQFAAHWQQMQTQLTAPGPGTAGNKTGTNIGRRIGKFMGGLLTVAIIAILAINSHRSNKKASSKTAKQQATIVTSKTTPAPKQDIVSVVPQTTNQNVAEEKPTAVVNKVRRSDIATTLISLPITKEQPQASINNNNEIKTPEPDAQALLNTFFEQLKKEEQVFIIETTSDTTVIAKDGTRLFIPAGIFTGKTGQVKGEVKIIVKEYIRYEDIIANKLSTTSNAEQLISGGMLHISAQQDGQPVTIAPQKGITVSIPTSHYDNRMMLFTGAEQFSDIAHTSILNWIPQGPFQHWADGGKRMVKTINFSTVQPVSVNYGKKTTAKFYLNSTITMPKEEVIAQLKQRFGSYYDNIKIKRVRNNKIKRRSANGEQLVIQVVDMDPDEVINKKPRSSQDSLPYTKSVQKQTSFNYEKREKQLEQYNFVITQMGWVNCDCFRNAPRPRAEFNVNLGNDITFSSCASQLVFTGYKSVIYPYYGYGHKIQFQSLPAGDQAVLVIVAVKAGHLVSSFVPLTVSNMEIGNLVFEPTTPEQFKQKLQSLFASQQ